jgi:hypothetical protein
LNVCTPPASVGGGRKESGFWPSSAELVGPGSLALRSSLVGYGLASRSSLLGYGCCTCPAAAAAAADSIPAAASTADDIPRNPRRETMSFFSRIAHESPSLRYTKNVSDFSFLVPQNGTAAHPWCQSSYAKQSRKSERTSKSSEINLSPKSPTDMATRLTIFQNKRGKFKPTNAEWSY